MQTSVLAKVLARCLKAFTWADIDLLTNVFYGIYLSAISQYVLMNLIGDMCSKIATLKLSPHLPGFNELNLYRWMQTNECREHVNYYQICRN